MTETSTAMLGPPAQALHPDAVAPASAVAPMATALEAQQRALAMLAERVNTLCEMLTKTGNVVQYMNTEDASTYLGKSVSWLLRQKSIPYYPGKPNRYKRQDLDRWMDENVRHEPML